MIPLVSYLRTADRINAVFPRSPVPLVCAAVLIAKTYNIYRPFGRLASRHSSLQQQHTLQKPSVIPSEHVTNIPNNKSPSFVTDIKTSPNKESLTVEFYDATFTFHAQWLHDAQVDSGPSKDAANVFSQKLSIAKIENTNLASHGARTTLNVTWNDGLTSRFPATWLRVFAPLVAKHHGLDAIQDSNPPRGWQVNTLTIPEFPYAEIFAGNSMSEKSYATITQIYDALIHQSAAGIVKVVGLPAPIVEDERNKENTLVTRVLKQIFGSVFLHPRRGADKTFNIASHHEGDVKRGIGLPNYNTNQLLLPHSDHAHYTHPIRVQGLYALEGESENTFVSCPAVLATLREETPHLLEHLCTAPMALGRVAHFYKPSMYQATVDTAVMMQPGFVDQVKRFRWHPHLTGFLLSPYDKFSEARAAHRKFQEIMLRETHQLKVVFKPGDMYLWDNFRVLHGRERVLEVPRTSVGQTVPEQVIVDGYRVLKMARLKEIIDEKWLVHVPLSQLCDLVNLVDAWES